MADGTVIINTLIDTKGFGKGVTNMQSQFSKLGSTVKKLGAIIGSAFSVAQIVSFAKEAVELGSDLQEVQNVVDVTFGGMSEQINEFAQNAIEQFGLSELAAKQYASTLGAIFKSSGFDINAATEMSTVLTGLAGDIASFYNLSGEEAFSKLRAGITGETEPLKQLGINLSVANLEAYALSQGITKAYDAMSQQEQIMLRYNYILSVTADAQGDFARTSESWANQTRILSERFNSLKATIGQGLINALTPVIKVINTILIGLQKLANAFAQFTALLFGDAGGSSAASNAESVAESYGSAADSAEDMEAATKGAAKAAKIFSGLDEVKVFDSGSGGKGDSGAAGGGGGLSGGALDLDMTLGGEVTDEISPKVQAIVSKIQELLQPLKEIDLTPAAEAFERLRAAIEPVTSTLFSGLEWAYYNLLVPLAEWTIEDVLPAFLDVLSGAFSVLNEVLIALQPLAEWLWTTFLQPLAEWTGGLIVDVLTALGDALRGISDWISEHQALVEAFAIVVGSFAAAWALVNGAMTLWNTIGAIATAVTAAFGVATTAVSWPILAVVAAIGALIAIIVLLVKNWDTVKEKALEVWSSIKEKVAAVTEWFKTGFTKDWTEVFGVKLGTVLNIFSRMTSGIFQGVKNGLSGIIEFLTGVFTGNWQKAWDGLIKFVKMPVNAIIGAINGLISGVVSGLNAVIRALNRISFTIPSWVPAFGGRSFGFNISTITAPQIPYLAKGAVIPPNAPFTAVLGDQRNGKNLEAPESLIRQIIRDEMGGGKGGSYRFVAQINRRTIFEEIIAEAKLRQDTTGENPFVLS